MNFSDQVLDKIKEIPEGKVTTYKLLAIALGNENASRAVGSALSKNVNPYRLDYSMNRNRVENIPCHRVIKTNFSLGGFKSNTDIASDELKEKIQLLEREGVRMSKAKKGFISQDKEYRENILYRF